MTKGIVRKLDELGRITLPKELRSTHGINEKDPIDIYIEGDVICLKPVKAVCHFCEETNRERLINFNEKYICKKCGQALKEKL